MLKRNSFTLIELLVVIAVLAGFVALLVPNFMEIRLKARDTKRKGDLFGIQKALELYKQSQSTPSYPAALPTPCTKLEDANSVYMQKVPQEPLTQCNTGSEKNYYYQRDGSDAGKYTMYACLENGNDPEGQPCPADFNTNTGFTCVSNGTGQNATWCYKLMEP
jgi:type II secretory pathway pseudopilin PulG